MKRATKPRYPFSPLEEWALRRVDVELTPNGMPRSRVKQVADLLGVSANLIYRWRKTGISLDQADRYAVRAGVHPFCLWPEMIDAVIALMGKQCAAEGCNEWFVPDWGNNASSRFQYCSDECRYRERRRRRSQQNRPLPRRCAEPSCSKEFTPKVRPDQIYCSTPCRHRRRSSAA